MSGYGRSSGESSNKHKTEGYSHADFTGAASGGDSDLLKKILDKNPSYLNKKDKRFGTTALVFAAANNSHDCLVVLIEAKADLTLQHDNKTALEYAVSRGHEISVEALLKAGASAKMLSSRDIEKYASLIEKHCPEVWAGEQEKLKFAPYTLVNETIVIKQEGQIQGFGKIRTMFNFNAKTVTEIINDNPGTPQKFDLDNKDQITTAYEFTVYKKAKAPAPFKKVQKVKI